MELEEDFLSVGQRTKFKKLQSTSKEFLTSVKNDMERTSQSRIVSTLAKPHIVLLSNICHMIILALVAQQRANEAAWRTPWDIMHQAVWVEKQSRCAGGTDHSPDYYVL